MDRVRVEFRVRVETNVIAGYVTKIIGTVRAIMGSEPL